ncbi:Bsc1 protein [Maudiozyma humilis]|uniref:Bsc1 protein n=1 Tax=Maudiozyma humilis TaxID=51915 RepID=A0AAV5RZK8_MAUHU|nr:Bsc1 protein [Kazachstania humilis]
MKLSQFFLLTNLFQKLVIATATDVYNGCPTLDFTWHTNQQNIINYSMDITDINQIQDNLFNITIHVTGSQQIPLKYLYSLKVIGIDGPNNYVQLYGDNEHTYLIDNPTDFSVSFEVYATLTGCKYWMPNFEIQFKYMQGKAAQYWDTWIWGTSTFDLLTGCDNYDNQGHSQTDFPGFYWNVGLPPECIIDKDPIETLGTSSAEVTTSTLITTVETSNTEVFTTSITQSSNPDASSGIDADYRTRTEISGSSGVSDSSVEATVSSETTDVGNPVTTTSIFTSTVTVTDIVESDTTFTKHGSVSSTSLGVVSSQKSSDNAASDTQTPSTITVSTTTTYPPFSMNPSDDDKMDSVPTGWSSDRVVSTVSDPGKDELNSLTLNSEAEIVTPTPQTDVPSSTSSGMFPSTLTTVSTFSTSSDIPYQSLLSSQLTDTTSSVSEPSGHNSDVSLNSNPTDNTPSATNSQTVQGTLLTTPVVTTMTDASSTCTDDTGNPTFVTKVVSSANTEETTSSSYISLTSDSTVSNSIVTNTTTKEFDYPSSSSIIESRSVSVPQDNIPTTEIKSINSVSTTSTTILESIGHSMNSYSSHATESDSVGTSIPVTPTTASGTSINSESTHVSYTSNRVTTTVSPTSHTTILIAPQTSTSSIPQVHLFENGGSRSIGVFSWLAYAIFVLQFF